MRTGLVTMGAVAVVAAGAVAVASTGGGSHDGAWTAASGPCARPYAASSPWNTPIPESVRVHQDSARYMTQIEGPLTSDPSQYTYPVYSVTKDTPRVSVRVNGVYSDVTSQRRLRFHHPRSVRLPVPPQAGAAEGSDAQIILVDWNTGEEWGAWMFERGSDGAQMENGYHYNVRWSGVPPRTPDGNPFGSRGAGVPYFAGLVRACEIKRGRIDHAIAFAFSSPGSRYVYPASKSDGHNGPSGVPEGSRLQLDPSISDAQLRKRGCGRACLIIARAMRTYGMYVIDNSGRSKIMLEYDSTAKWNGRAGEKTVSPIPMSAFRVVEPPRRVR